MAEPSKSSRPRPTPHRRNPHRTTLRWSNEDYATLMAEAERGGVTVGTFIRSRTLAAPTTRSRRRASVDVLAIAKLLAAVHKAGVNLHQIARHLNFGGTPFDSELRESLALHRAVCAAILAELHRPSPEAAP